MHGWVLGLPLFPPVPPVASSSRSFPTKVHLNFGCYGMTWMVNLAPFPQANSSWFSFLATLTEAIKHLLCYRPPNRPWRRAHQLTQTKLQLVGNLPSSEEHSKDSNPGLQGPEPVLSSLCHACSTRYTQLLVAYQTLLAVHHTVSPLVS